MNYTQYFLISVFMLAAFSVASAQDMGVYRLPHEARDVLVEMKAAVRHGSLGGDFIAPLTPQQVKTLRLQDFHVIQLYPSIAKEKEALSRSQRTKGYSSYDRIRSNFYAYAAAYPNITRLEVLGHSVQNRELFALKISSNPQVEEDEPELAFWGCIHGDEFASAEIPHFYALYLCDNYGVDPTVTKYIDENEIWCIPMINPDGHELGTRGNANKVDINRDFGYQWDGWGGSLSPFSQVETRTVREFCLSNNITLSTSVHCSGDVLFYPWGYSPNDASDLEIIKRMGKRYANAASYAFVKSWVDYETHGEVLDFVYGSHGGLCYTVEICNSFPSLRYTYDRNQAGMNIICEHTAERLNGVVTDAKSGQKLWAAVWVSGSEIPSYTDPTVGDMHRLVMPGMYDLTVWANGYLPLIVKNVVVDYGSPGHFRAALNTADNKHAFMVCSVNQLDTNNVYKNVTCPSQALGAPDGVSCSLGNDGFIVLDMGSGHEIIDGRGDDFIVIEAIFPRDPIPEAYLVFAGDAYDQNTLIGSGVGTTSFDLKAAGVNSTRYLKIVDRSGSNPDQALAGMDLDGITLLNSSLAAD